MSKTPTSYTIIEARTSEDLIDLVKRQIINGWIPFGSLLKDDDHFYQTMIFFSKKKSVQSSKTKI